MTNKKIVFYYPSNNIGGAQLLFMRLAEFFIKNFSSDYDIYYIDYANGYAKTKLNNSNIIFIDYIDGKTISLPENTITITSLNHIFHINRIFEFDNNVLFIFWSIAPNNLKGYFHYGSNFYYLSKKRKRIFATYLIELYSKHFLQFMDYSNYISNADFFQFTISKPEYLQIPVIIERNYEKIEAENNFDKIRLGWLGRIDDDKINSIKNIFFEINRSKYKSKIDFYIIGNGNCFESLIQFSSQFNINAFFVGQLEGTELENYILKNIDIGIAMGTSSLELGKMAIPVIIVDSYRKVFRHKKLKYNLLYSTPGYSLGDIYPFKKNMTRLFYFDEALQFILDNYDSLSTLTYNYVKHNHSLTEVSSKLNNIIKAVNFNDSYYECNIIKNLDLLYRKHNKTFFIKILEYSKKIYRFIVLPKNRTIS